MYKVLVVDDEPLMLEGWMTMVDWEACGYQLCGTSANGEDALELIRTCDPDLVVTDIRMPVIDGLQLIRIMKEELKHNAKTVIVSGYSEFGYAQQALRYEVDHYLLKPLVTDEIHNMLLELAGPLEERRLVEASDVKNQSAAVAAAIVGLFHDKGPSAVDTAARLLGTSERACYRLVMVESLADPGEIDGFEVGGIQLRDQLAEFAEACCNGGGQAWSFEEVSGRFGLLVCDEDGLDGKLLEARLKDAAAGCGWSLHKLAIYCSGSAWELAGVRDLYRQTMEIRNRESLRHQAGIHVYHEPKAAGEWRMDEMMTYVGALLQSIETNDQAKIDRTVNEFLHQFDRMGAEKYWIKTTIRHIHGELLRRFIESGASPEETAELRHMLSGVDNAGNVPWTGDSLKRLCMLAAERLTARELPDRTKESAIMKAVDYLKQHFREKIRLQELADRFHLTPAYFGQQFKRETEYSFNDYIHHLRIEEARKLLRRTDMLVSDIALTLGYHDTEYFTQKFKAVTGELPSSFKNKRQG
ncbi:response regulator [Paenibacillus sp. PR3]|uniref:Response regulator n=1 Tax=Paenibacillus terricola TaxID=2763503 RepID=A0ABR8MV71_9BACL|nr:response regulator [Paenibacillus terricola]MBD3919869.1 response regulator [Paenibacillus terricola]